MAKETKMNGIPGTAATAQGGADQNNNQEVDWEKRFKDTQAAYTKSRQELAAVRGRLEALEKAPAGVTIDPDLEDELNHLKVSDPDAWRARLNQIENEAANQRLGQISEAEKAATERERRQIIFDHFRESNPDIVINDDVIEYDIPKRITRKLEKGEIEFESFLTEVADYLRKPKTIGDGNKTLNQPNLGKNPGGSTPSDDAGQRKHIQDYSDVLF